MVFGSTHAKPLGQWPIGISSTSGGAAYFHQCRPNDPSTWKLVPGQDQSGTQRLRYKCKGCPTEMLR